MADPNKIPLEVTVQVSTDCGHWTEPEACKAGKHSLSTVRYEISARQNDTVAGRRVEDLQRHGRRLLQDEPKH